MDESQDNPRKCKLIYREGKRINDHFGMEAGGRNGVGWVNKAGETLGGGEGNVPYLDFGACLMGIIIYPNLPIYVV